MVAIPVEVIVSDAAEWRVANAPIVFQIVRETEPGVWTVQSSDTVLTNASGEARFNAAVGPVTGAYRIVVTAANAQVQPTIVNVSVIPDAPVRVEIVPDSAAIGVGESVALSARSFDRFGNVTPVGDPRFRSLTPSVAEISDAAGPRVNGVALGTALVVLEHEQLSDTARVVVLPPVAEGLALGARHSCLLSSNGSIACWGAAPGAGPSNEMCGTTPCVRTPRTIPSTVRFESIAAGGDQTCASSGNALYCWGRGGAVPGMESTTPQRVPGNFVFSGSVTVGVDHACTTTDGVAYCWGNNSRGQLGTGDRSSASSPTPVLTTRRFRSLRAGRQFTCGATVEYEVLCWGANSYGELGRGFVSESEAVPDTVRNLQGRAVTTIYAGAGSHVCALPASGSPVCWGRNDHAQFGNSTLASSSVPQVTSLLPRLEMTATGTCGSDGKRIVCWGSIGEYQYNAETVLFTGHLLKTGDRNACASTIGGTLQGWVCWGDNSFGALGDGTLTSSRAPVKVLF